MIAQQSLECGDPAPLWIWYGVTKNRSHAETRRRREYTLTTKSTKHLARQAAERKAYFEDPANTENLNTARLSISLAKIMHNARISGGLTQQELARRLHTRQSYIAEVEKGKRNITIDTLERYAAACGKHVELKMV